MDAGWQERWRLAVSGVSRGRLLALGLMLVGLVALGSLYLPEGIDWHFVYRPAALSVLSGKSPYGPFNFYAAPWALVPLIPLAVLPERVGRAVLFVLALGVYAYVGYRLGAKRLALAAFLLSPPVLHGLLNSNVEWLPLLGYVLPPPIGLFLVAIKPQIGLGAAVFWLVEAWRRGRAREVVRVFWPFSLALLVSFVLYGPWPLRFRDTLIQTESYNASLWPSTIPIGLALLVAALRRRDLRFAMAASPCLSPYVLLHAWVGPLAAILSHTPETIAAVAGLWILMLLRGFTGTF